MPFANQIFQSLYRLIPLNPIEMLVKFHQKKKKRYSVQCQTISTIERQTMLV